MTRENEKPLKPEPLNFLPLKWRELLQRLAVKDKREEIAELLWLIEEYAAGRLTYADGPSTPRVTLNGHGPRPQYPEKIAVRSIPSQELPPDPSSPQP